MTADLGRGFESEEGEAEWYPLPRMKTARDKILSFYINFTPQAHSFLTPDRPGD
jgi:hypothetical protein